MSQSCFYLDSTVHGANSFAVWQDTGIDLAQGEAVSFKVEGSASVLFKEDGPSLAAGPDGNGTQANNSLTPEFKIGTVVGRINGGAAFKIGAGTQTTAAEAGKLEIGFNDSLATDNKGGFFVGITVGT